MELKSQQNNSEFQQENHKLSKAQIMQRIEKNEFQPEGLLDSVAHLARRPETWTKQAAYHTSLTNQGFWHAVETFLVEYYHPMTEADPEFRIPLKQLQKAVNLLHLNSVNSNRDSQSQRFILSKDYYQLLERHVIRSAAGLPTSDLSTFNLMLNQLTRNRHFQQQQSESLKDICVDLLIERYSELSHANFAMMCRTLSFLAIKPGSVQHKSILMAMKEYLQEEHQNIETKTMYAIARSIRLGNKRLGGVSYSSTHIDILVCSRILSDKVKLLDQMIDKYSETGEDGKPKSRVSDQEIQSLDLYFEAVRTMRVRAGSFDATARAEVIDMVFQVLFLIKESLPAKSITRDLSLLGQGTVAHSGYRTYLLDYVRSNMSSLPQEQVVLLPQIMDQLEPQLQELAKAKLSSIEPAKDRGSRINASSNSQQTLEYLLKPGNKDWSEEMQQMVVDKIRQSRSMFHLNSILDQVIEYGVTYEQNEEIWESIYNKALDFSQSDMPYQREPFENIVLNLSSKAETDPAVVEKVGSLLENVPNTGVSIETILKLRNDAVLFNQDRNDIHTALEMRAIAMLAKFGGARGESIHLFKARKPNLEKDVKYNSSGKQIMRKVVKKVLTKK